MSQLMVVYIACQKTGLNTVCPIPKIWNSLDVALASIPCSSRKALDVCPWHAFSVFEGNYFMFTNFHQSRLAKRHTATTADADKLLQHIGNGTTPASINDFYYVATVNDTVTGDFRVYGLGVRNIQSLLWHWVAFDGTSLSKVISVSDEVIVETPSMT